MRPKKRSEQEPPIGLTTEHHHSNCTHDNDTEQPKRQPASGRKRTLGKVREVTEHDHGERDSRRHGCPPPDERMPWPTGTAILSVTLSPSVLSVFGIPLRIHTDFALHRKSVP